MADPESQDPDRETQRDLPEPVKECEKSVRRDNPDMDRSTAIAICQDLHNRGKLEADSDIHPSDRLAAIERLGIEEDVPDDYLTTLREAAGRDAGRDAPSPHRFLQADFSNLDAVRRTQEGDDVRYENLVLIGAGEWTDATGHTEYYTERALRRIAEDPATHVEDNTVNVDHKYQDQLLAVGHFDTDSLTFQNGLLLGDVVIYGDKQAGEDIIADMDRALESDGQHGAGGFSIQIPDGGFERQFNAERGIYELTEITLAGGAIVTEGASGPANFDEQFPERAVALAAEGEPPPVRVLSPGDSTKAAMRQGQHMSITDLADLGEYDDADILTTTDGTPSHLLADGDTVKIDIEGASIEDIRDALGGGERDLQGGGEMDVAQDLIEQAESEGFDTSENSAADLIAFIQENLDPSDEELQALQDVADAYLQAEEAESLDATPAEGLLDFIAEQGGADEDSGHEEGGGEMAARVDELERELEAREETVRELAERVETLEDRPDYPERDETGADGDEESRPADVLSGLAQDGEYIGR